MKTTTREWRHSGALADERSDRLGGRVDPEIPAKNKNDAEPLRAK